MQFEIEGPYELYRRRGLIDTNAERRRAYWEWISNHKLGLPEACGCYIFAIQAPRGTLPWYVGKAEKQSFRGECLTPHKINHFNNALAGRRGKPVLFFLPQVTKNGAYRKPSTGVRRLAIRKLETLLISMALRRNQELQNSQGLKFIQELTVKGFLNSRKARNGPAVDLRDMLI